MYATTCRDCTWSSRSIPGKPQDAADSLFDYNGEVRTPHSLGTLARKTEKPRVRDPRRATLGIPEKEPVASDASGQWSVLHSVP